MSSDDIAPRDDRPRDPRPVRRNDPRPACGCGGSRRVERPVRDRRVYEPWHDRDVRPMRTVERRHCDLD